MTNNPIKVSIYNPINNNILKTYIYLGDKSKQIYNAVNSIQLIDNKIIIRPNHEKILNQEYGTNWKHQFTPTLLSKYIPNNIVGSANQGNSSIEDNYSDILGQIISDSFDDTNIKISDKDIESEIGSLTDENLDVIINDENSLISYKGNQLEVGTMQLFNEDSIFCIKEKIYIDTLIPPFRQHLFWIINDECYCPYDLYIDNIHDVDIRRLTSHEQSEGSIYIDKRLYNLRNEIKVIPRDTFILLGEISTTQLYVVDLQLFTNFNKNTLINSINDKYKLEHIYYGFIIKYFPYLPIEVFRTFITNPNEIANKYYNLSPSKTILKKKYDNESNIINVSTDLMNKINENFINKNLIMGITKFLFEIIGKSNVNLRNIFDVINVSEHIPEIHAYLSHDNHQYFIKKTYKYVREDLHIKFPVSMHEGVIVLIRSSIINKNNKNKTNNKNKNKNNKNNKINQVNNIYVNFLSNGSVLIKGSIDDDMSNDFENTVKYIASIINPFLDELNLSQYLIFNSNMKFELITKSNIIYKLMDINLYWKKTILDDEFKKIRDIWNQFISAGMITDRNYTQNFEFVFTKGMHVFDESLIENTIKITSNAKNYYSYLLSPDLMHRWNEVFNGKHIKMIHRTTDIKFEMLNLVESEYLNFFKYVLFIIDMSKNIIIPTITKTNFTNNNKLKKLREYDPVLYNLKKYGSKINYSILCQNPTQPLIITDDEIKNMSTNEKNKLVKYWNFTLKKPAYYMCPNNNYPYLNFIVGVHPHNYCMPCCKKIQSKIDSKKTKIASSCLSSHTWNPTIESKVTDLTRYITIYGKEIGETRLSRISNSLNLLFENTLNGYKNIKYDIIKGTKKQKRIKNEYYAKLGYYIYGINKGYESHSMELNSFLNSILFSHSILFSNVITKFIKLNSDLYKQLLNGRLYNLYPSHKEFISHLSNFSSLLKTQESKQIVNNNPNGNNFTYMVLLYDVYVCFHNKLTISLLIEFLIEIIARIESIHVLIYTEQDSDETFILNSYISNFISGNNSHDITQYTIKPTYVILNKLHNTYNPICIISPDNYFYNGYIFKKHLDSSDPAIRIIFDIIMKNNDKSNVYSQSIDLTLIKQFTKSAKDTIILKYISNYNLCYGVLIDSSIGKYYIPINFTHNIDDGIKISLNIPSTNEFNKMNLKFSTLWTKIHQINNYLVKHKINNYKQINTKLISMITNDGDSTNEFFNENQVFKFGIQDDKFDSVYKQSKKIEMKYSLDDVNLQIKNNTPPAIDNVTTKLNKAYYHNLKYQLFYNEFLLYLQKEKNNKIRNKIMEPLTTRNTLSTKHIFHQLKIILTDFPEDYIILHQLFNNYYKTDKHTLIDIISNTSFTFDNITLKKLHELDKNQIIKELKSIVPHFTIIGKISDDPFPNIYLPCNVTNNIYCNHKKLIIEDNNILNQLIDLLASDIINPIKFKYMMNHFNNDNIIEYFHFNQPNDTNIIIENLILTNKLTDK